MQDIKDLLLADLFKNKNTATVDSSNYNILRLNQGQTLAYKMCDKTLAVEMHQAVISDFELDQDAQHAQEGEIPIANFDMAYLDI